MIHGSLFSGVGGFDLAARWVGWNNLFHSEIDPFCLSILKYHFPNAKAYTDVRTTDFSLWRGKIDVLSGGFPCQPFSQAGKRRGIADDRYLWPEMHRAIQEIRPRWVLGENVLGIVNWNEGMVFEKVCADLETAGYEVQPFVLPAAGVNAPHQRYRTWFVAKDTNDFRRCGYKSETEPQFGEFRQSCTRDDVRVWGQEGPTAYGDDDKCQSGTPFKEWDWETSITHGGMDELWYVADTQRNINRSKKSGSDEKTQENENRDGTSNDTARKSCGTNTLNEPRGFNEGYVANNTQGYDDVSYKEVRNSQGTESRIESGDREIQ